MIQWATVGRWVNSLTIGSASLVLTGCRAQAVLESLQLSEQPFARSDLIERLDVDGIRPRVENLDRVPAPVIDELGSVLDDGRKVPMTTVLRDDRLLRVTVS